MDVRWRLVRLLRTWFHRGGAWLGLQPRVSKSETCGGNGRPSSSELGSIWRLTVSRQSVIASSVWLSRMVIEPKRRGVVCGIRSGAVDLGQEVWRGVASND